jgi:hypothetical protein
MRTGKTGLSSTKAGLDTSASAPADQRLTWSITVYAWPDAGIATSGKAATLDQAKAEFQHNWIAWSKQEV